MAQQDIVGSGGWRQVLAVMLAGVAGMAGAATTAAPAGTPPAIAPETLTVESLPAASPHWLLVNDFAFLGPADSKVYLADADSGQVLGMISTGWWRIAVEHNADFTELYLPETYYARGTRGERTDVVSVYSAATLAPIAEVVIPSKRASGVPLLAYQGLSVDDRWLYVANMTPATSVSVVDVANRRFVGEIPTPGCALVFPGTAAQFHSLCESGRLLTVTLAADGTRQSAVLSEPFFDPKADPVTEKAVRNGNTWYFLSFDGQVHEVDVGGATPAFRPAWSLFDAGARAEGWRIGGVQLAAVHAGLGRLYVLVHQGGVDTHKDPGTEVWTWDLATRTPLARFPLAAPASTVQVSRDAEPLLYVGSMERPVVEVLDARSGKPLRVIEGVGMTPALLQTP